MENLDSWVIGTAALKNTFFSFDIAGRKMGFVQNPKNIEEEDCHVFQYKVLVCKMEISK